MNVSACLVTRGDVDMQPVLGSLPAEWEIIMWDNDEEFREPTCYRILPHHRDEIDETWPVQDLSVYGRYAAIEYASHDLIYVQDDDVIVSDPQAIVDAWVAAQPEIGWVGSPPGEVFLSTFPEVLVANMPQEFRHDGYTDSCLVGFGACFHRDAPQRAWGKFNAAKVRVDMTPADKPQDFFYRTCDVVFTTLTPRVLVDVPRTNREFAEGPDRMYRQPDHVGERARMLELARKVRDA